MKPAVSLPAKQRVSQFIRLREREAPSRALAKNLQRRTNVRTPNPYVIYPGVRSLILALSLTIGAQTATATLKGTMVDGGGNALTGAVATLTNNATGLKKTFTTKQDGQFIFTLVEPGFYTLEA